MNSPDHIPTNRELPEGISRDEHINYGFNRLTESGIATHAIADRFMAGERIADLAEDYGIRVSEIEAALRFEFRGENKPTPEDYANQLFAENGGNLG